MVAWSSVALKNIVESNVVKGIISGSKHGLHKRVINYVPIRKSGHGRTLNIRESQYQYAKFVDYSLFYFFIGAIPLGLLIAYTNIYIGPATLAAIPEGYEPKHWEYYRHPISRFIARYLVKKPQEIYERNMHHVYIEGEMREYKILENKINQMMRENHDYQAWYFRDPQAKFPRYQQQVYDKALKERRGHSGPGYLD